MRKVADWLVGLFLDPINRRAAAIVEAERAHEVRLAEIGLEKLRQEAAHAARLEELRAATENNERARAQQTQELLEAVLDRVQTIATASNSSLSEVAGAMAKQGEALGAWMDLFKQHQGPGDTMTLRPEDEWAQEQARELQKLKDLGYLQDEPAENAVTARVANMFSSADRG